MTQRFRTGDVILFDGLYACGAESCDTHTWGVPGRRFGKSECGHAEWRLVRRRIDHGF